MTAAELQRLRAELRSDHDAFEARAEELSRLDLRSASEAVVAQAAVALHHAYGAVEAALVRVARVLEGAPPQGADWHQHLLHAMTLEIPTVRPRVLGSDSATGLRRLLGFRHFFRHAYTATFDAEQLASLQAVVAGLRAPLVRDIQTLDAFLETTARALES